MTYDVGDGSRLSAEFTDPDTGTLADPTTITLQIKAPNADPITYTYGSGGQVVKDAVGKYHSDILITSPGTWNYRWVGTGALVAAADGSLFVRRKRV